jgi:hypothetical protein
VDAGGDAGVLPEVGVTDTVEGDEGEDGGGDAGVVGVGVGVEAGVDVVGVGVGVGVGGLVVVGADVLGVGDVAGVVVWYPAGDEYVLAGWDVLACDAGLAGEDRGADEAVDAEPWGFADAGGVA